jgi:hypothetical protein
MTDTDDRLTAAVGIIGPIPVSRQSSPAAIVTPSALQAKGGRLGRGSSTCREVAVQAAHQEPRKNRTICAEASGPRLSV